MGEPKKDRRDWRISAILLAVWVVALVFITGERGDIPLSMIGFATVFFIILIPAMNELVRTIERSVGGETDHGRDSSER